ncbi:PepSY domain-containing protein [Aquipseudomonas ullengensis]|uniref:PepSY domain-containing protein n=1 Tax=Aquipseudomonas ullengensis TaxID=2759166 RepID=A0A7W4QA36_9GAMM|nr:PepSY domain-containing protein [Pseudomonas ullengensis]MBB2495269.1 PepSY domain-containing protein [Pseudomonas ullengensis]
MKRYFYLWHRWLGIGLCLFMALWFVSGVVMLYVGYPKLTPAEHLAHLPDLPSADCCVSPGQALAASGRSEAPSTLRLSSVAGTPRYLLGYADGTRLAVDARSGQRVAMVDAPAALASARQFAGAAPVQYLDQVQEDTWSHSRALDPDRPLHRVQVADAAGSLLYISGHTGAVVRDASRNERAWNWLGAWLHWLYPLRDSPWWAQIVIYLSLAATLMALLGQVVGLLRWRFTKPYRSGSRSPYAGGFARWHHIGGLLFGAVLIAWIFSGLMSMNPWQLFASSSTLAPAAYRGGDLSVATDRQPLAETLAQFRQAGLLVREVHWQRVGGQLYRVAYDAAGESRLLAVVEGAEVIAQLPASTLEQAARAMLPGVAVQFDWLERYDAYYYPRAEQSMYGHQRKRLPMLRARFADPAASWVHLDPYSGALIEQLDQRQRVSRWLFNLLHSWDWLPLLERPLLREGLVILFSLGGLAISLSGIVLGWRRLQRI